jgi:hypothetical protein
MRSDLTRKFWLLLVVLTSLAFAPAPFPRPARKPTIDTMLGTWVSASDPEQTVVVTPKAMTFHRHGAGSRYEFAVDLAKRPATYDLGRAELGVEFRGICCVESGKLILHYRPAGSERPRTFGEDGGIYREVYVRPKQ